MPNHGKCYILCLRPFYVCTVLMVKPRRKMHAVIVIPFVYPCFSDVALKRIVGPLSHMKMRHPLQTFQRIQGPKSHLITSASACKSCFTPPPSAFAHNIRRSSFISKSCCLGMERAHLRKRRFVHSETFTVIQSCSPEYFQ